MTAKATYTGCSHAWHGAIKANGKLVWKCGHNHHNRDQGGATWGRSARGCAESALRVARMTDAEIEQMKRDMAQYHSFSSMSPKAPWKAEYELSVRDEIRAALGT
jgi:hypothetical protein